MRICITFILLLGLASTSPANQIQFDAPAMVPAYPVAWNSSSTLTAPTTRLVAMSFDVSVLQAPDFRGEFLELLVVLRSNKPLVRIVDYSPRTELASNIASPIQVQQHEDYTKRWSLVAVGGYPGVGSGRGEAYGHELRNENRSFAELPSLNLLTTAGTLERGSGVFFKFRKSPQTSLEGSRRMSLLVEVPFAWQGDVVEVKIEAFGTQSSQRPDRVELLNRDRFWLAVYDAESPSSANSAIAFVNQQNRLRTVANEHHLTIQKQAFPSPIHRIGHAFDIYEPTFPNDYLERWMFGDNSHQPPAKLPVPLRVAMLDFMDGRIAMEKLSDAVVDTRTPSIARHVDQSSTIY